MSSLQLHNVVLLFPRCHPIWLTEVWRGREQTGKLQDLHKLLFHAIQVVIMTLVTKPIGVNNREALYVITES